jgi:hypothetical protein
VAALVLVTPANKLDTDGSGHVTYANAAPPSVDDIHDEVVEGTLTFRQVTRLMLATLAGKSSGGGTVTITFQDVADTKARVTATADANGNRTAITLDGA